MYLFWGLVSDELASEQWDGCHAKKNASIVWQYVPPRRGTNTQKHVSADPYG